MDLIFVVLDQFSKYVMFIVAPSTYTTEVAADLSYRNMVKYFDLPEDIVSDRDLHFTGQFWIVLFG